MALIAILTSGESGADSLIDINANFASLNTGKAEVSGQVFTGAISATNFSGTSSGANTGDQTNITGNAATVTTNANLTGPVTSIGNATTITALSVTNAMLAGAIDITTKVTGILPITNGGTGSSTQNWVDLTSTQSIAGFKTFTSGVAMSGNTISLNDAFNFDVNIATGSSTGTVSIGNGASTQTINIGNDNTPGTNKTVVIGTQQGASTTNIRSGTGGTTVFSNGGQIVLSSTGASTPTKIVTSQGATTSVMRMENSLDAIDTFITAAAPQGVITGGIGDTVTDSVNGGRYEKGTGSNTTTGWEYIPSKQFFRLNAVGTAITTTAANFFGATSGIGLTANAYYKIEMTLYFLKTTNGTVTFNLVNSSAPTSQNINVIITPATGIASPPGSTTGQTGDLYNSNIASQGFTTASLTGGVNHSVKYTIYLRNGAGTSLNLQALCSAGSITPGIGSFWEATRLPEISVGNLV